MPYHTAVQGEHLSGIARKYGFHSAKPIWDHPENAALKKQRQNPNVLLPGDRIFIPDRRPKQITRSTGKTHRFRLNAEKLTLRIVLEDLYEKPIAHAPCELRVESDAFPLETDASGKIEQAIAADARSAALTVKDPQTPLHELAVPIRIGDMDPVDTESGQRARLDNLGYFAGPLEGKTADENRALFLSAVEEFQCDHGLTVDGKCGPVTQAKLRKAHGC